MAFARRPLKGPPAAARPAEGLQLLVDRGATPRVGSLLPGVRVVMLTSSAAVDDVERARGAGAFAYLTKDADAVAIAEEVVRAAAAHHPLSERRAA